MMELPASPTVSVVIPTYERREYVCRAVRSVFAQRYTDWELIVIDDGSSDGTGEALQVFGPRLRYLWQENKGVAAARNAGLCLARGEIVTFLDSDNRWLPDHLETLVAMLEHHPDAVLASTCVGYHIGGRQNIRRTRVVDALPSLLATLGLAGYTSGMAVRRDVLLAIGGFDERLKVAEDHHLWIRLAGHGRFCFLRRRTIVRQTTKGSLIERGIRNNEYLRSFELIAEAGCREVARQPSHGNDLAARARAAQQYVVALQALARSDRETARLALSTACRDLPDLSTKLDQVANRIVRLGGGRRNRQRHFADAATLWPDPCADTALFLRARAIALALRDARCSEALRLLGRCPLRPIPRFVLRNARLWTRLLRRAAQARLYRGRDDPPRPGMSPWPSH